MRTQRQSGFTVVELLIVIVVIAILAAITIVAYNGIQDRAKNSAAMAAASQAVKKLEAYKVQNNDSYPTNPGDAGISVANGSPYTYTGSGSYYCLTATQSGVSYFQSSSYPSLNRGTCDGLIAWWPLNNSSTDFGPNSLDGAPVNVTSAMGQNGKSGGAYAFNGTSSQVTLSNNALLNPGTAITVSAWYLLAGTHSEAQGIVTKEVSGSINNPPYVLQLSGSSVPMFNQVATSGTGITTQAASASTLNTWNLLTGTFEGNTSRLYLNGEFIASNTITDIATTSGGIRIGQQKSGNNRWFNGSIDDVRIYNRALSATEIRQLYIGGAL